MDGGGIPSVVIANQVWASASRSLTSFSLAGIAVVHSSIATATSVDLRPGATFFTEITVEGEATANVTYNAALYDGTTFRIGGQGVSGAGFHFQSNGTNPFGPAVNNSGTAGGFINVAGANWHT